MPSVKAMASFFSVAFLLPAQAAVIVNVDFLTTVASYSGPGAIGTGTFWNYGTSKSNLTADDGITSTTISYSATGSTGGVGATIPLFSDYLHGGSTLNITGLDNSLKYNLVLYGAQNFVGGRGATFTVGGVPKSTSGDQQSSFAEGVNYVRYDNLSPTSGAIAATVSAGPEGVAIFNGFQLEVVPEPSAGILLLGAATTGLLRRRRFHA